MLGCAFWTGAEVSEPGVIHQDGARAAYPIGEPDGQTTPRLTALVKAMTAEGLHAPIQKDIRGQIWIKMINSLCWNQVPNVSTASSAATLPINARAPSGLSLRGAGLFAAAEFRAGR